MKPMTVAACALILCLNLSCSTDQDLMRKLHHSNAALSKSESRVIELSRKNTNWKLIAEEQAKQLESCLLEIRIRNDVIVDLQKEIKQLKNDK